MTTDKPWTDAHRREALLALLRIVAAFLIAEPARPANRIGDLVSIGAADVETEASFRATLADSACLDAARIEREVRRVRGLAEGRLVRETIERHMLRTGDGVESPRDSWESAKTGAAMVREKYPCRAVRARVTRIRRAA